VGVAGGGAVVTVAGGVKDEVGVYEAVGMNVAVNV